MEISLQELAGGALQEKVNQAFEKVMQNMQDPNTPWKNKMSCSSTSSFFWYASRNGLSFVGFKCQNNSYGTPYKSAFGRNSVLMKNHCWDYICTE